MRGYSAVFKIYSVLTVVLVFAVCSAGCISAPAEAENGRVLLVTVPPMMEIVSAVAGWIHCSPGCAGRNVSPYV